MANLDNKDMAREILAGALPKAAAVFVALLDSESEEIRQECLSFLFDFLGPDTNERQLRKRFAVELAEVLEEKFDDAEQRDVYCIRNQGGLVKVGVSSDPDRRLRELQTVSPQPLELVGVFKGGGLDLENWLHESLSYCHEHGEWFRWEEARPLLESLWASESSKTDEGVANREWQR